MWGMRGMFFAGVGGSINVAGSRPSKTYFSNLLTR
jgi:hypothetical protein